MLNGDLLDLLGRDSELSKLRDGTKATKFLLFNRQRLAVDLLVNSRFDYNLLMRQTVDMEMTSFSMHLDALDIGAILIEEPSIGIVDLLNGNRRALLNRSMVARQKLMLGLHLKRRIRNQRLENGNGTLEGIEVTNVENNIEICQLT